MNEIDYHLKKIIFFSPHADDIALSLGGLLIHNLKDKLFNVEICTVYSISNHCPYIKSNNIKNITKIRNNEDKEYAKAIKGKFKDLGFYEALTRGYKNISSLYNDSSVYLEQSYNDVKNKIEMHCIKEVPDLVFFPCGIGNHIEHRILSTIGSSFINSVFYEDLPYAADYAHIDIINKMEAMGMTQVQIYFENLKERQDYLKQFYPSQISDKELNKVSSYFLEDHLAKISGRKNEELNNLVFHETFWSSIYSANLLKEILSISFY